MVVIWLLFAFGTVFPVHLEPHIWHHIFKVPNVPLVFGSKVPNGALTFGFLVPNDTWYLELWSQMPFGIWYFGAK